MSKYDDVLDASVESIKTLMFSTDEKWRKSWTDDNYNQQNHKGRVYRSINQINLFNAAVDNNFSDPRWFTFNQIKKMNENKDQQDNIILKKGAKGQLIGFFTDEAKGNLKIGDAVVLNEDATPKKSTYKLFKTYFVFNASQIEGIKPFEKQNLIPTEERHKKAELLIKEFCQENNIEFLEISSQKAFFRRSESLQLIQGIKSVECKIVMPLKSQFNSLDEWYMTAFHECGHATSITGKRTTFDDGSKSFGSKNYACEELVAETAALFLAKETGISCEVSNKNSAAYLRAWYKDGVLNDTDLKKSIIAGSKAANIINGYMEKVEKSLKHENTIHVETPKNSLILQQYTSEGLKK